VKQIQNPGFKREGNNVQVAATFFVCLFFVALKELWPKGTDLFLKRGCYSEACVCDAKPSNASVCVCVCVHACALCQTKPCWKGLEKAFF
jgi:hypothetical protein